MTIAPDRGYALRLRLSTATWYSGWRPKSERAPWIFRADFRLGETDFGSVWHVGPLFVARILFASFAPLSVAPPPPQE